MKAIIRVPTDMYAYIEVEFKGTELEIVDEYQKLRSMATGGVGVEEKDFNKILDNYLWGAKTMTADEYVALNLKQQEMIQMIKKSRNRQK
jgi:hypothetical protein